MIYGLAEFLWSEQNPAEIRLKQANFYKIWLIRISQKKPAETSKIYSPSHKKLGSQ